VKPGTLDADIHFGELGYAREARASYLDFVDARNKGILPKAARFLSMPTPWAVIRSLLVGLRQGLVELPAIHLARLP
jgi:hypothetical protein